MRRTLLFLTLVFLAIAAALGSARMPRVLASSDGQQVLTPTPSPTPGPARFTHLIVKVTKTQFWLSRWSNGAFLCSVIVEHEGLPTGDEILAECGTAVHTEWKNTQPCIYSESGPPSSTCKGVTIHEMAKWEEEREVRVDLDPPDAWLTLSGCTPAGGGPELPGQGNRCSELPALLITGEEPLPNELIISIQGTLGGQPFSCMGPVCAVPLTSTGMNGAPFEFWAESSFGDSTIHYTGLVRVVPWGDFAPPEGGNGDAPTWYVDVISPQWRGGPLASCSQTWESFPGLGGPPAWLSTPERAEQLYSSQSFYYLAGRLIEAGQVDASACPNGGLQAPGVANACGLEKAQPAVTDWQNQFDGQIIQVAKDLGVPAQLMKSVFARESQFWPGIFRTFRETGLGQMTENGADIILLWNPTFYHQFCPLVLDGSACQNPYTRLGDAEKALLKGALVNRVNAACPDCPAGVDLPQAAFSVNVFGSGLRASCEQAGQVIHNATGKAAGLSASYEDLWRFTLINYNAGSGCLSEAVGETQILGQALNWVNVTANLDEACAGAIQYVEDISALPGQFGTPTPTPAVTRGAATQPAGFPTATPAPGQPTLAATLTLPAYPVETLGPTNTPEPYP